MFIINHLITRDKLVRLYTLTLVTFISLFAFAPIALADREKLADFKSLSEEELARELSNPATPLASLNNVFEFSTFKGDLPGADSQTRFSYSFQPSIPFPLDNGKVVIFRPLFPLLLDEPVFNPARNGFDSKGVDLGDITFDLVYGGTEDLAYGDVELEAGILSLFGIFGSLPTATDDEAGSQQWRLGPEVVVGLVQKWGLAGFIAAHSWDLGGSNDENFSTTTIEYFYAYGLGGGWQIAAAPVIEADWEAENGETWTVPIGIGIEKTTKFGDTPWNFALEAQYYIEQPDSFGPEFLLIFTITPVIANPFAK
jgi:hypothetical protein